MQIFFLFEKLAPRFWELAWGLTRLGEARIIKPEAVMPLKHPGQPLLAAIPPGKAGKDPGRRCDGTLGSSSDRQHHRVSCPLRYGYSG